MEPVDLCEKCTVPEKDYDPGDLSFFTCGDCACFSCEYLHACLAQCQQEENCDEQVHILLAVCICCSVWV